MRSITRSVLIGLVVVVLLLLALGAVPSLLRSGDPYYMTATAVDDRTAVNATDLPERRYPYTTAALAEARNASDGAGRSAPYWRGPVGLKEPFSHSPFDEVSALGQRADPGSPAVTDDAVYVRVDGQVYRLAVVRRAG